MRWVWLIMIGLVVVFCVTSTAAAQDPVTTSVLKTAADTALTPLQNTGAEEVPTPAQKTPVQQTPVQQTPVQQSPQQTTVLMPVIPLQPVGYLRTTVRPTLFGNGTVMRQKFIPYRQKPCRKNCCKPAVQCQPVCCVPVQPPVIQQVQVRTFVPRPVYGTVQQRVITGYTYEEVQR